MPTPHLRITDLLLLVAAVAVGLALWSEFARNSILDDVLVFATYLGLLTTSAVGWWAHRLPSRPFFAGFAAFSSLFLLVGLRLGYTELLLEKCDIGMGYAFMTGVACRWVAPSGPFGPRTS